MNEEDYMKDFREIRKARGNIFTEEEDRKVSQLAEHDFLAKMRRDKERRKKKKEYAAMG